MCLNNHKIIVIYFFFCYYIVCMVGYKVYITRKEDNMKNNTNTKKPSNERKDIMKNYSKEINIALVVISIALAITVAILVYKGNHPKLSDGKQVVASIEGKDFTAEDVYTELSRQYGYNAVMDMVNSFIVDKEVENKADALKYAEAVIAQYKEQYKNAGMSFEDIVISSGYESVDAFKKYIADSYLYNEVGKNYIKKGITDEELKAYYDEHVSDELSVKHILIAPDVEDNATSAEKKEAEKKALEKAKEIISKLNDGEDFETLAKENSDDTGSASNGGVINNVIKDNYVTEFWDAANKLEVGKYTAEPVKSKFGYHIIYKVSHTPKKSFEEMKDSLYDKVVDSKINSDSNLVDKTWIEIRKNYKLEINDTTVKRIYDITIKNLNSDK